ncbi:putative lipoprotein [Corallococcus coralloides]|uniref:Putative lipoprotein n=1 Tax=Corallococcus coralloides TaxID=184914 RepID=A0A410RK26_CORCK|nr:hypothetical protein [Corallococcus coralloides]QAT82254.1 putative lipoprotein [Corallococcus coralloides]
MRNLWKVGALGAVFGAVLSVGGCSNFDAAFENCESEGRCGPQATGDGGTDAGDGGDGGDTTPPPCGDGGVDYPDLTGFDNDCDGIDGVADAGYFVDPTGGKDDGNDGTRERPFQTLDRALREIRDGGTGRNIVYLGTGTYNEQAPVVDMPVSLYGGYTWRGNQYWDRFKDGGGATFFDGGTHAFTVTDVTDAGVLLDSIHIASADAPDAGAPSIALRAHHTADLRIHNTILEAGRGGAGEEGPQGGTGAQGAMGEGGGAAQGAISGSRGAGGISNCAVNDAGVGGAGGGCRNFEAGNPGLLGAPGVLGGSSTPGGNGGDAGIRIETSSNIFQCVGAPGLDGGDGINGTVGQAGAAGKGSGTLVLDAGTWQRTADQQAGSGFQGKMGAGGGGGGGGGTCSDEDQIQSVNLAGAGGGGGGGGGGCGGLGGTGGGGGGASIALLLIDAHATLDANAQLVTRGGGAGGRGGVGGNGGPGGSGGTGGARARLDVPPPSGNPTREYSNYGGAGGSGGRGGAGGPGGVGGGGAGGPSVGVWCALDAGFSFQLGSEITLGNGGEGGASTGNPGDIGAQSSSIDCYTVDAGTP